MDGALGLALEPGPEYADTRVMFHHCGQLWADFFMSREMVGKLHRAWCNQTPILLPEGPPYLVVVVSAVVSSGVALFDEIRADISIVDPWEI